MNTEKQERKGKMRLEERQKTKQIKYNIVSIVMKFVCFNHLKRSLISDGVRDGRKML